MTGLTVERGTVDAGLTDAQLWVSIAEAARQQTPVVSRAAMHKRVSGLVRAGRLSTRPGQRGAVLVNIVALNRAIAQETDPAQALRNRALVDDDDDDDDDDGPPLPGSTPPEAAGAPSYHSSRANREAYQAENARLDLEERLGRTIDATDAERRQMTVMRKMRDRLLALPATIADDLAGAPDARAIRSLLSEKLRAVLTSLADELDKLADDDDDGFDDDDAADREPGTDPA